MNSRLGAGMFYGKTHKQRRVRDIGLTESVYSPAFTIPKHSHESAYFGLVLQGTYSETYEGPNAGVRAFHPAFSPRRRTARRAPRRRISAHLQHRTLSGMA